MNSITSIRVYLHYHDYILDGRWVVTENIDSDDKSAVVRNKGDGWDDEECPEKETYHWELRSRRGGWPVARSRQTGPTPPPGPLTDQP